MSGSMGYSLDSRRVKGGGGNEGEGRNGGNERNGGRGRDGRGGTAIMRAGRSERERRKERRLMLEERERRLAKVDIDMSVVKVEKGEEESKALPPSRPPPIVSEGFHDQQSLTNIPLLAKNSSDSSSRTARSTTNTATAAAASHLPASVTSTKLASTTAPSSGTNCVPPLFSGHASDHDLTHVATVPSPNSSPSLKSSSYEKSLKLNGVVEEPRGGCGDSLRKAKKRKRDAEDHLRICQKKV